MSQFQQPQPTPQNPGSIDYGIANLANRLERATMFTKLQGNIGLHNRVSNFMNTERAERFKGSLTSVLSCATPTNPFYCTRVYDDKYESFLGPNFQTGVYKIDTASVNPISFYDTHVSTYITSEYGKDHLFDPEILNRNFVIKLLSAMPMPPSFFEEIIASGSVDNKIIEAPYGGFTKTLPTSEEITAMGYDDKKLLKLQKDIFNLLKTEDLILGIRQEKSGEWVVNVELLERPKELTV